ncbi:MAG: fused response regulator/phosphatase [Pseudomonadota bacterium]|nr:fused response regulator/phosphatase [Pseudomonadota bacterium]
MSDQAYILAVDDEPINRFVIEDLLDETYELTLLESGQACIESVQQRKPDLILLDINMPTMDGYEVCRLLQENPDTQDIPVVFLTAKIQVSDEQKGLELGAVDYITKPFSEALLLARIKTHLSLSLSKKMLAQHNAELQKERAYIERIILNMRDDADFVDESICYLMTPVEETNGDLLLSAKTSDHRYFLIGDFTGHGLASAMGGPLVSALFYMLANEDQPLKHIIHILNKELYKKLPKDLFMAALFIDWDTQNQQVKVWNFGMSELLYYRNRTLYQSVPSSCFALGITDTLSDLNPSASLNVQSGDHLFAYSDGVIEACSEQGERFGSQRLIAELDNIVAKNLPIAAIYPVLKTFVAGKGLQDDVTMMNLKI